MDVIFEIEDEESSLLFRKRLTINEAVILACYLYLGKGRIHIWSLNYEPNDYDFIFLDDTLEDYEVNSDQLERTLEQAEAYMKDKDVALGVYAKTDYSLPDSPFFLSTIPKTEENKSKVFDAYNETVSNADFVSLFKVIPLIELDSLSANFKRKIIKADYF